MNIQACRTAGSKLVLSGLLVVLGLHFPVSGRPWSAPKNGCDFPRQEKVPIQDDAELIRILEKSADYCDRLKRSALDFVCRESVKEEDFRYGIGEAHVTTPSPTGDGTRIAYSVPELRKKTQKMSYIYDYQLIKKGDVIIENRTLLEENGKKKEEKQALLKTKKFFSLKPVFGPVGFLAREWQSSYDYKLVKEDTLDGVKAFILEVRPKVLIEGKPNYGKIWVAAQDGSVLRIDIEQESLIGFELIQEHAEKNKLKPFIATSHIFGFEKNGLRFPSQTIFEEAYSGPRIPKYKTSKTVFVYKDYKFFTVSTDVDIK